MSTTVLIADDTVYMCSVIRDALAPLGLTIVGEANSGEAALAMWNQHKPDLVILNIVMPPPDGLAVLKHIKSAHPQTKVLMCSGMGQAATIFEAIRMGADDFVVKPFNAKRLQEAVLNVVFEKASTTP